MNISQSLSPSKKGFPQRNMESSATTCCTHLKIENVGHENHFNLAFLSAASNYKDGNEKVESHCLTDTK